MVIGLLALMMVMAVAFAVYMRTERVAAGAFRNDVRARQFLHVALARALADLDANLGNNPYPDWDIFVSTNGTVNIAGVTNSPVLDWIPRAPLLAGISPWPKWVNIGSGGLEQGRIGYMIVNCSGLLDANASGDGVTSRSIGTNVCEIQLDTVVANKGIFVAGRSPEKYETIQELSEVGVDSTALLGPVSNFACFSYFPTGYVGGTNIYMCDISGDETVLAQSNIVAGLVMSGIANSQANFVFTNLLDYVDTNCIPHDLGSACTESVPMFNEIGVTNRYRLLPSTNVVVQPRLNIEWFYPFVKAKAETFWITWQVSWSAVDPPGFSPPPSAMGSLDSGYASSGVVPVYSPALAIPLPSITNSYVIGQRIKLKAHISLQMRQGADTGPMVDATPFPTNLTHNLDIDLPSIPAPPAVGVNIVGAYYGVEVVDPRFNWLQAAPDAVGQWYAPLGVANTLGAPNTRMLSAFSTRDTDGYSDMFVADRPLKSVSELSYILRGGKPGATAVPLDQWNTIRLYDTVSPVSARPLDRVLDHFFIPGVGYGRGLVNPNTSVNQVLAAVLEGMPINSYPEQPPPVNRLTANEAMAIAANWIGEHYTNTSDIGHAVNVFSVAPLAGLPAFQKESIFRNTAGLFNTRQQYFVIVLFAQATRNVPNMSDVSVVAGGRAITEVWRDPLKNTEGVHPHLVRLFKVLNSD